MNLARHGYTVALFSGYRAVTRDRMHAMVLVEMYEQHRPGDGPCTYHYRAHDLIEGRACEVKTIGFLDFDPETATAPPALVQRQFEECLWRRLR